jgi:hypothetical protein
VVPDFPLDDLSALKTPDGLADLAPDGTFVVRSLRAGVPVHLVLLTDGWGIYHTGVPAEGFATWTVSWQTDPEGLAPPPPAEDVPEGDSVE